MPDRLSCSVVRRSRFANGMVSPGSGWGARVGSDTASVKTLSISHSAASASSAVRVTAQWTWVRSYPSTVFSHFPPACGPVAPSGVRRYCATRFDRLVALPTYRTASSGSHHRARWSRSSSGEGTVPWRVSPVAPIH